MFLGNSLTYCNVPEEHEDKTKRGLAATSLSNDYVHRLVDMIAKNNNLNIVFSATNIAEFERHFKDFIIERKLSSIPIKQPDILVVQIGENVFSDEIRSDSCKFVQAYCNLLDFYPNVKAKIITLPFMPDKYKNYCITDVALQSSSYVVDLSHLYIDENLAQTQMYYRQPGVGIHPGDIGMEHIASSIYSAIKAVLDNSTREYSY